MQHSPEQVIQAWLMSEFDCDDPDPVDSLIAQLRDAGHSLVPRGEAYEPGGELTGAKLRDVAWALDALTKLTVMVLEPLAAMDDINAEQLEVGVTMTIADRPMTPEQARTLLDWVGDDAMQSDLRRWADQIG